MFATMLNKAINAGSDAVYRRWWQSLILLGCVWVGSAHANGQAWQAPEYILDAFYRIAFKSEYIEGEHGIRKWQSPIRYHVAHPINESELHDNLVSYHLTHLRNITGVDFISTDIPQRANLSIVFTNHARFLDDARTQFATSDVTPLKNAVCAANFKVDEQGVIRYAAVVIPVDLARSKGKLVACVVEELTQVMGLPNDDDRVFPSIFNDQTPEQLLTGLDSLLLQLLYLDTVKPGQDWQTTREIIRPVIAEWAQDGTIDNAHRTVKSGELYPLLGW
ncbi:DUF2927 domain-containing protein [Salinivibrio sp. ES.052]|uniref:DUF2927 domain-containing protein n=1 Tax=Salinivibrio sp. ES.052 TaxID=1882823 RepID=UPI00092A188F|nr:DUF2927 domain-containing protein [Salinivibrio sp. ES.052]SIN90146.1 Protein of unknown function [Salinivibrio sp. ES.052]